MTEKQNNKFKIEKDILHQMLNVLKFNNKTIFIIVHKKIFYECMINDGFAIIKNILKINNESSNEITLAIGSLKLKKIEWIIQKATEIGVKKILIVQMERSISTYKNSFNKKIQRWNKIALEASEQSKRNIIPKIIYLDNISMIEKYKTNNNIVCYENEDINNKLQCNGNTLALVGPEGGITNNELEILNKLGFKFKSLTKTILRAETAAIYAASILIN